MSDEKKPVIEITPEQARKRRNVATALAVVGFMVLVFLVTIAKLKGNVS
jgi:hypothetical protein